MNKIRTTGIVALLLSLAVMFFNIPVLPIILFGIGVVSIGYDIFKTTTNKDEDRAFTFEGEPLVTIEDLPSLDVIEGDLPDLTTKVIRKTPCKSTGTKLVKPLVEEQLNPKFRESVKKTPVKKQVSKVIKGDPLAKDKPKRRYKKRKPRVKK